MAELVDASGLSPDAVRRVSSSLTGSTSGPKGCDAIEDRFRISSGALKCFNIEKTRRIGKGRKKMKARMNERTIGQCSMCGGRVTLPEYWHGVVPPVPTCQECGAVAKPSGPVIPMERPRRRRRDNDGIFKAEATLGKSRP